ncbi:MAG: TonB family protein [Bacteroidaceae bacterium]|nr:TonB family protein [Bacteroidaceae bacterium]
MEALLIYLLKSATLLTVFVALFVALMQQETYHRLNRFTLLAIIALSLALPCVNLGIETPLSRLFANEPASIAEKTSIEIASTEILPIAQAVPTEATTPINWGNVAAAIYIAGVIILLVRLVFMYAGLARTIKRGTATPAEPYTNEKIKLRVREEEEIKPFSWFRWVVINRTDLQESGREILTHEAAHARSLHSMDIIIIDLLILLQWFNPMAWFTKYCMKNIHEYEADEAVINSGTNVERYQQMIIKKAVGARLYSIANSFNHSSTYKRITMMCKKKSNKWRCTKALYILPAAAIAALLFSQPESVNAIEQPSDGKVTEFVANNQTELPATAPSESTANRRKVAAVGEVKHTQPSDTTLVYQVVEQMPEFPGGTNGMMTFLRNSIIYPLEARDANIQGKCFVTFVVDSNGKIKDARVQKSSGNEALDKESVRVVESMPRWTPGKQNGKNVAVQYTLPIMFRLQGTPQPKRNDNMLLLNRESPLLIINGAVYEGNAGIINNIKEEDIESINVLEEEAATKLYGEKGKYGAIVLELKKHTQFDPKSFTYDAASSSSKEPQMYQFNVGIKQGNSTPVKFDTPGAEFIGDTSDLQLGNRKTVLESGLTEGSVTIEFNVETDGTITFAKVTKSSGNNAVDSEALALIYNTYKKWKPATKDGKPVRSRPSLTLTFSKKG